MGGILDSLGSLLAAAGVDLPPWGLPVFALIVMLVLLPRIFANMETSRARRLVQRSRGVEGDERVRMEQKALEVAGARPMSLVAVADEAIRIRRSPLAVQAVERLAETDGARDHLRRLRKALRNDDKLPGSALAAALVVERLLDAGAVGEAGRRLGRFEKRWPGHPDLQVAARKVQAARAEEEG
ncbi:MAG: hypothetical protein VX265_00610 [Myxococcota bacterium]|nr:hypothetical protein [Myxococcota bacterium]